MKKGRAKKLLGICIFLMGLMIFSVLPVQAAAPRMYTIQPGKTWTRYDITGDGKKDRIKVVRKKSQYDGCWNGADIYVNNTKACAINKAFMDMSIRIITDSASDMSPTEHPALRVLPLSVTFGTDVYMDGIDIDHQRFYEMLVERDELPKTGQVNPYAFSQAIAEAREAGDEAVIITVGAKLSGTNQSARTALAEAPGGDVYVVDSNNVTLGERVLVEYALRLVDEGRSAAQIATAVEAVRDRVVVIGLLETLEYLVRGGRLSAAAGAVGTLLNVKPVVAAEDGLIVQLGKARGSKNGRNLLNQKVEQAGGVDFSMPLALGYTGLSDAVLKKYIEDSAALWAGHAENELPIHTIGATIGTHVGPGAVAVAFFRPAN